MDEIILSVLVPTYNHENYIEKALDSIINQKTSYKYEVLVGEDLSPDNTRNILKKYEEQHPNKIIVFYRDVNLYKTLNGPDNHMDLLRRAKGKYVIFLEGDDYWIDDNKIETQIKFLENNLEYIAVAHNCIVVDKDNKEIATLYPECKEIDYNLGHYVRGILPGQLATVMMRNIHKINGFDVAMWEKRLIPGDRIFYFTLLNSGKIYCIQKQMSAYRYITDSGTSFSANVKYDFYYSEYWHSELAGFAIGTGKKEFIKCAETLFFACLVRGVVYNQIGFKEMLKRCSKITMKWKVFFMFASIAIPVYLKKFLIRLFDDLKTKCM